MSHVLAPYRAILSLPGALAFSLAGVLARFHMSMLGLGIVLMVSTLYGTPERGDYAMAGRVVSANVIAFAICSPQISKLVDRFGQARVMRPAVVFSGVSIAALVAAATAHSPEWVLYIFAVLAGAAGGSIGALVRARWSYLVKDPAQLHTAYSLESVLDEFVFVVGPVLATVLATSVAPQAGLIVAACAIVGGGLFFMAQKASEPPPRGRTAEREPSVLRAPGLLVVAAIFIGIGAIFGATDVATVAFAEEQGQKAASGVILAVFAGGSFLGGLLYGARQWASPLWRRFVLGVLALGVGVSLFFVVSTVWLLAAAMFVVGFAIAPTLINGNGLVQQFVRPTQLTEGLTWANTALTVGVAAGAPFAGQFIETSGSHGGFQVVVYAGVLAVVITLLAARSLRRHAGVIVTPAEV
ncbi:MAG: MFS transporter [Actinomycetales bacterium]|nr:MFS transporter [Actinomycetales bacterium]